MLGFGENQENITATCHRRQRQTEQETCAGYIQIVYFDIPANEIITLGGAGFITKDEHIAAWNNIQEFSGDSSFIADRLDDKGSIIDSKPVSAETCERLMSTPIAQLIADGRAKRASAVS